ncbi:hypothetical protein V7075_13130, partial [Neobacillus drentensis]|uniref:hypothetical protein n=1 Tax=Neobacillus drentensis TaxID=220684 RepID=UPI002FFDF099
MGGQMPGMGQMPGTDQMMGGFDQFPADDQMPSFDESSDITASQGWFDPQTQGMQGMGGPM